MHAPLVLLMGLAGGGEAFSDLSLEEARARATAEGRILVVDGTAAWCGPCQRMEKTTWVDPRVLDWLDRHGLAIQVDVDTQRVVAGRLGIRSMPTLIAFRGETEIDRIVGYRDADALLDWLDGVRAGRTQAQRDAEHLDVLRAAAESTDVEARVELARELTSAGRHDEALEQWLWLWAEALEHEPAFGGVRRSFWVGDIAELVEEHEPARAVFARILDGVQGRIDRGEASAEVWLDWVPLCKMVGEESRIVPWYDEHRDGQGRIDAPTNVLADLHERLAELGRFADAGRVLIDPLAWAEVRRGGFAATREHDAAGPVLGFMERRFREGLALLAATQLAAGRDEPSRQVTDVLLGELNDAASRVALVEAALRCGVVDERHLALLGEAEDLGGKVRSLRTSVERVLTGDAPAGQREGS